MPQTRSPTRNTSPIQAREGEELNINLNNKELYAKSEELNGQISAISTISKKKNIMAKRK